MYCIIVYLEIRKIKLESDRYHFVEIDTNIFKIFITDIWPVAGI